MQQNETLNLKDSLEAIQKIENEFQLPWEVSRVFGKAVLFGSQVMFGEDRDFVSLSELKQAIAILVHELDGKVVWKKDKK